MSTGFNIKSGLLEKKHYDEIGSAIWVFLWLIDRITKEFIDERGRPWGVVLGGKPIKAEDIAQTFSVSIEAVKRNLRRLADNRYIKTIRTPYGKIIHVYNSGKWKPKKPAQLEPPIEIIEIPNFVKTFHKEFGRPITPNEVQALQAYIDSDGLPEDLIIESIKRARLEGKVNVKYAEGILKNWLSKNIKTMQAVILADEEFKRKKVTQFKTRSPDKSPEQKKKIKSLYYNL